MVGGETRENGVQVCMNVEVRTAWAQTADLEEEEEKEEKEEGKVKGYDDLMEVDNDGFWNDQGAGGSDDGLYYPLAALHPSDSKQGKDVSLTERADAGSKTRGGVNRVSFNFESDLGYQREETGFTGGDFVEDNNLNEDDEIMGGVVDSRFIKNFLNKNHERERQVRHEREKRNVWQSLFAMDL
eukprot:GDKK01009179.1.p1 GENE.GDKK01009179.1~~GDKK01009179.1.p1  ORF type:complete len:184 (-),score=55.78 GDKK01009179.1:127-678(-)